MQFPILLPNIFNYPFTYESNLNLSVGDFVEVPFGTSKKIGVVWNEFEKKNEKNFKIKRIIKKLDIPKLNIKTLNFLNWFSEYNLISKGMALKMTLLSGKPIGKFEDKFYKVFQIEKKKNLYRLTKDQKVSLNEINNSNQNFNVHVLQGTTGSGKTIVYFEALKVILKKGYQGLIMLPEIGLTNQFEKKFLEFFGIEPAIWHSGISKKNKEIIWSGIVTGKIKVVIGARSALFLPFKKLGLIIVDEEHDQSYKQDEGVTYNARDMAVARAQFENIPINLVSAVPSIETYENIQKKKYSFSRLINRYKNYNLPKYEIINLNQNRLESKSWISPLTKNRVQDHLLNGDQVLFFLNRRGYSPTLLCKECYRAVKCNTCDFNLNEHKFLNGLLCHLCGTKYSYPEKCDHCGTRNEYIPIGPGVERIQEEISLLVPNAKVQIISSDHLKNMNELKNIFNKIELYFFSLININFTGILNICPFVFNSCLFSFSFLTSV